MFNTLHTYIHTYIHVTACTYVHMLHLSQDKENSIRHDDLGRDIATVQALQRKHETFEHELEALGNQVE